MTLHGEADSIMDPYGEVTRVDGDAPYAALRAGVHTVFAGGETSFLAVGVPPSESDLTEIAGPSAARRLGMPAAGTAVSDGEWQSAMFTARRGRSLLPVLLGLVALLAVAEVLLASPGRTDRRVSLKARVKASRAP